MEEQQIGASVGANRFRLRRKQRFTCTVAVLHFDSDTTLSCFFISADKITSFFFALLSLDLLAKDEWTVFKAPKCTQTRVPPDPCDNRCTEK
jgi:hypothetical protein